jgi:type VI secretion system protein ImpL
MSRSARAWIGGSGVLLLFVLIAWIAGALLGLEGRALWLLRGGLLLLGVLGAAVAARILWVTGPAPDEGPDDVALALAAARERLARSSAPSSRLGRLPLTLVVGPRGSTKTTLVARTGLEPELLAGEVYRGDLVVETEGINLWYHDGTVVLEAGGALLEDEGRWKRLLRRIRPSRLAAALGRGGQAPRSVVLCFGADEFLKPGAGESVPAQARIMRQRLAALCDELGISVPVYVLFTRSDRFPFFLDYVRNLGHDEVVDPLGATLELGERPDPGSYVREEGARIRAAFEDLHRSLGANRLRVLAREANEEVRGGAYEFPRELRKVAEAATSFLVELTRPSQLGRSPVLRGFYFTGVRPVIVRDAEPSASPPTAPAAGAGDVGATGVFQLGDLVERARAAEPVPAASRKVPQWVFLDGFLRTLLPGDRNARALTAGGARVDMLRRLGLGAVGAASLIMLLGVTVSYFGNRALQSRVLAAAEGVAAMEVEPGLPPTASQLERLDALRTELETLRLQQEEGVPLRLRWGLHRGERLVAGARPVYFRRFDQLLWETTRTRLAAHLDGLEGEPGEGDDYGRTYDALRAYLVTTRHPDRSQAAFLTPALMAHWPYAGEVEEERRDLARGQFEFFARELPWGHPLPRAADDRRVATSREFLLRFAETDRVYQALLSEGSEGVQPVEFARFAAGAGGTLRNDFVVPGAFTEDGWTRVHAALGDVDRLFAAEEWVVGEQAISAEDRARLTEELRARYVAEYTGHWQSFLRAAVVPGFGSVGDAARRLDVLSGNQSPVLQVLAVTARNTAVDAEEVRGAFQPVHLATPPDVRDRFVSDANEPYMAGLVNLHASMDQLSGASGARREQLMGDAASNAEQAKLFVRQLAQGFSVEGPAQVAAAEVQRLMEAPVSLAEALITRLPAAEVNQGGQAFCAAFSPILQRYPFSASAQAEVSMDDLEALFGPGDGALWGFYEDVGRTLLARQGSRYVAAPGASPQPTDEFVAFFNRAAEVSRAFFGDQGRAPEVVFAFRPETSAELPEVGMSMDGQSHRFTRTVAAAHTFVWEGARARDVRITGLLGGQELVLLEAPEGPWGLFRLLRRARWESMGDGRYRVTWPIPERRTELTAELTLPRGIPVLRGDFLDGLTCAPRIAR